MKSASPIGLYDSGIGGLSVVREVFRQLPHEAVLYFGDTARVPYGGRSVEELISFNREILGILLERGAKAILVACNTSSAVALDALDAECPVPILGLIEAGARAAVRCGSKIGIIATAATIASGAHARAIASIRPDAEVLPVACPRLVPMIESGDWNSDRAAAVVIESLGPLLDADLDALVLGCTHYPIIASLIQSIVGPGVKLVDPAQEAVRALGEILAGHALLAEPVAGPAHTFLVSGDADAFALSANRLFGTLAGSVEHHTVRSLVESPTP
ncbi:Glutamate racemase 1 [compost metagenome]